jgi:hypothetical protein
LNEKIGQHFTAGLGSYRNSSASSEQAVGSSNRGFQLLEKFGWKKGCGLGKTESGILAPIEVKHADALLGLGKQAEYDKAIGEATRERKKVSVRAGEAHPYFL